MKPTDVTDEMVEKWRKTIQDDEQTSDEEVIANAVNAVLGDPMPITAERLVANGYVYHEHGPSRLRGCYMKKGCYRYYIEIDKHATVLIHGSRVDTETIGQLRALEIGLGIKP